MSELEAQPAQTNSLRGKLRWGAIFMGVGNFLSRVLKAAVQIALAWWLDPTDYGLVAMTIAFMMIFQMLSEFGVVPVIIQKKDMPSRYPSTAFWLNWLMSFAMVGVAWLLAPWLADFYHEPLVIPIVRVSSLGFLVIAIRTVPMALMRKRLQFAWYSALDTMWQVSSGLLALAFAWAGARYWSLVIPQMIAGVVLGPLWFIGCRWRPSLTFDRHLFGEIFKSSKNVMVVTLATFMLSNAGFIIAGHFLGTEQAGIYKFAMENAMFITINIAWLIANVVVSGFALVQDDNTRLRDAFGRVYDLLLATTLPMHVLLFVQADLVFAAVFPDKWASAIPLFRVLLVCSAARSLVSPVTQLFYAVDRSHVNVWFTVVQLFILPPTMYYGCKIYGLMGLAAGTTVVYGGTCMVILLLTPVISGWESLQFMKRSLPWLISCAALAGVAFWVTAIFAGWGMRPLPNLAASSTISGLAYLLASFLIARSHFRRIVHDIVPERFRARYLRFLG